MSLGAMFFMDLRFCTSRKGGIGGGRWVYPKGTNSMAASGLSYRKHLVGTGLAISLLYMNGLRKWSSGHVRPPFPAVKLLSHSVGATIDQEPRLLKDH